jgi:hypothetical protein
MCRGFDINPREQPREQRKTEAACSLKHSRERNKMDKGVRYDVRQGRHDAPARRRLAIRRIPTALHSGLTSSA